MRNDPYQDALTAMASRRRYDEGGAVSNPDPYADLRRIPMPQLPPDPNEPSIKPYNQTWRDRIGEKIADAYSWIGSQSEANNFADRLAGSHGLGSTDKLTAPIIPHAIDYADDTLHGHPLNAMGDAALGYLDYYGMKGLSPSVMGRIPGENYAYEPFHFRYGEGDKALHVMGGVEGRNAHISWAGSDPDAEESTLVANALGPTQVRRVFGSVSV